MNKDQFLRFLKEPTALSTQELDELEKIIQDYPYFQSARALIARGKKQLSPKTAPKFISSAAVYVTDRVLLKKYINGELFFLHSRDEESATVKKEKVPKKTPPPAPTPPLPGKGQKIEIKDKKQEPAGEVIKTGKIDIEEVLEDSESTKNLDELIKEVYQDLEDLKQSKARFREWERKQEEEDAVNSALEQAIGKEKKTSPKKVNPEPEEPESAKKAKPEVKSAAGDEKEKTKEEKEEIKPEAKKGAESKTEPEAPAKTTQAKKTDSTTEKKSGSSKARVTGSQKATTAKKTTPKKPVIASSTKSTTAKTRTSSTKKSKAKAAPRDTKSTKKTGSSSASQKTETPKSGAITKSSGSKKTTAKKKDPKKEEAGEVIPKRSRGDRKQEDPIIKGPEEQQKIISEFIDKDPDIMRPAKRADEKDKSDLSEKSTRFHVDIASEYLAEIYIEQGKYDRAIEIYENLSLKFPEKKSFFASRIKQLKKK